MKEDFIDYIWFIKESKIFMQGHPKPIKIFFKSLYLGIGYVKDMRKWRKKIK